MKVGQNLIKKDGNNKQNRLKYILKKRNKILYR